MIEALAFEQRPLPMAFIPPGAAVRPVFDESAAGYRVIDGIIFPKSL
jgi:hypothetical protein